MSPTDVPRPHLATPAELADWDTVAVEGAAGHVLQSRAWAEHRSRSGWQPEHWVFPDGSRALVLRRPWPLLPGGSAYVPRGPVPAEASTDRAALLIGLATVLAERGVDVIAADPEVRAETPGYLERIRSAGFHPIEEIQPARHRLALALDPEAGEEAAFARIARPTRQRIRAAERSGLVVVRYDRSAADDPGPGFRRPIEAVEVACRRFAELLGETGRRRGFGFDRDDLLAWWIAGLAAGHVILLLAYEAAATLTAEEPPDGNGALDGGAVPDGRAAAEAGRRGVDGEPIAGLLLYRHGRRLTTVHSGDLVEARRRSPGALHLLRWRAIQLALREGRTELDLGGVDRPGARRVPAPGDPLYGLYEHKRSFGAEWLELAGAHELVVQPIRYAAGRVLARLGRALGRR